MPIWRAMLGVFALALAVRIAHASFLAQTPWFRGPIIDSFTYHGMALRIAAGGELTESFYQPPLYPWVLGQLYRAGIEIGWGLAIAQSVCGAATCALLVLVGSKVCEGDDAHRRRVGVVAGCAAALAGPLVLYDLEMMPPALVHLLLVSALAIVLTGPSRASWRDAIAGLLIGIAATGWVLSLALIPCAAFARRVDRRWAVVVFALVGASVPLAFTAHHNATHGAPGAIVSWNGGLNLWIGNNPRWRQTWLARPGAEFEPEAERPRRAGAIAPVEQDRWFQAEAMQYVAARPGAALARTSEKLYYAWHGREIRRNQDFEILRESSPVLRALQWELGLRFPFGLIAPLALIGIWRRRRERVPLLFFGTAFAYSLAMASYFVATRYRLPMLLLLLPLAADTALSWIAARPSRWELGAFAALVVALNLPVSFTEQFRATPRERMLLEASAWRAQGGTARAQHIADALLARWPDDANVQMLQAELDVSRGDCASAVGHLEHVAREVPDASTPALDLARCYVALGRLDDAEHTYANLLARDRTNGGALRGAAVLYMEHGRPMNAIAMFERLRASRQGDDGVELDYGRLLLEQGRSDEAVRVFAALARRRPRDPEIRAMLARARAAP